MAITVKTQASQAEIAEGNYSALLQVYGKEYAVSYVAGEIVVRGLGNAGNDRRAQWQKVSTAKLARSFVAEKVANLGAAFMAAHNDLYEINGVAA